MKRLAGSGARALLPSPRVRFEPSFAARVGRWTARLAAARNRREGAGRSRLFGSGSEFVGFRPYRPGEDLRQLDWSLYARTRKPFVRVSRREASEEWALFLDTSASMGVGQRGKLQLAAEVAAGTTSIALRFGATVTLMTSCGRSLRARPRTSLAPVLSFLESLEAHGAGNWGAFGEREERARGAGRVVVLGDLLDLEPRDVLGLQRPGRELQVVQVLAPEELSPAPEGPVEWVDPEAGARVAVVADRELVASYDEALAHELEDWGQAMRRHRVAYGVWSSDRAFEDVLGEGLFGA